MIPSSDVVLGGKICGASGTAPPVVLSAGHSVQVPLRNCQCNKSLCGPAANTSTEDVPDRTADGGDIAMPPNDCQGLQCSPTLKKPSNLVNHNA